MALSDLRFGDFNNNGLTDVIAIVGGSVMASWEGQTAFQPLNGLVDSLAQTMVVDLDGNGKADVIRFTPFAAQLPQVAPRLDVSRGDRLGDASNSALIVIVSACDPRGGRSLLISVCLRRTAPRGPCGRPGAP